MKQIALFIEMCLQGDCTLEDRYDFIKKKEKELEDKITSLSESLDYLRWKKWYYSEATKAETESIFFKEGTTQVDPKFHEMYLKENK